MHAQCRRGLGRTQEASREKFKNISSFLRKRRKMLHEFQVGLSWNESDATYLSRLVFINRLGAEKKQKCTKMHTIRESAQGVLPLGRGRSRGQSTISQEHFAAIKHNLFPVSWQPLFFYHWLNSLRENGHLTVTRRWMEKEHQCLFAPEAHTNVF